MGEISFFTEDIDFVFKDEKITRIWIEQTIKKENHSYFKIQIIFCSDDFLLNINQNYLNHDYFTDIITFPYHNESEAIEGDIFISVPRVKDNAQKYFTTFANEFHRVIIHGILHLIGYKDYTDEEKNTMRHKEDFYLSQLK